MKIVLLGHNRMLETGSLLIVSNRKDRTSQGSTIGCAATLVTQSNKPKKLSVLSHRELSMSAGELVIHVKPFDASEVWSSFSPRKPLCSSALQLLESLLLPLL
ncbi:MAG: hypothetical protein AAF585_27080 [Verrucomicrobiota bacterium]